MRGTLDRFRNSTTKHPNNTDFSLDPPKKDICSLFCLTLIVYEATFDVEIGGRVEDAPIVNMDMARESPGTLA